MPEPCPICGNPSNAGSPTFRGRKEVTCDTCGQFQISDSGEAALKRLSSENRRAKIGGSSKAGGAWRDPVSGRGPISVIRVAVVDYLKAKWAPA